MTTEPSDPESVERIAAALRADTADAATFARVLATTLPETLPPDMVRVERDRSLADRLAGRAGEPRSITVTFPEKVLELGTTDGRVVAEARTVVRGVVISRARLGVDEWVRALASELAGLATHDAAARAALASLLGQS